MRRRGGFTLIELMIVVAILAILAVVAVPSFVKYMRRAKTTEAIQMLEHIFRGSVTYFSSPRTNPDGTVADCMFPDDAPPTPADSCCEGGVDSDADGRCDAAAESVWAADAWQALSFQMTDHHYYVYSFASQGINDAATFSAQANGDLDCDGDLSTFKRSGLGVTSGGARGECSVRSSHSLFMSSETE